MRELHFDLRPGINMNGEVEEGKEKNKNQCIKPVVKFKLNNVSGFLLLLT